MPLSYLIKEFVSPYSFMPYVTAGVTAGAAVTTTGDAVDSPVGVVAAGALVAPISVFSSMTN